MSAHTMRIGLDNSAFSGRLRRSAVQPRPTRPPQMFMDGGLQKNRPHAAEVPPTRQIENLFPQSESRPQPQPKPQPQFKPEAVVEVRREAPTIPPPPQPQRTVSQPTPVAASPPELHKPAPPPPVEPADRRQQPSLVLKRPEKKHASNERVEFNLRVRLPITKRHLEIIRRHPAKLLRQTRGYSKTQKAMFGMAGLVFMVSIVTSIQTMQINKNAAMAVAKASAVPRPDTSDKETTTAATPPAETPPPSTAKPTPAAAKAYTVAPDLARYLKIPKLGVNARVLQVGVKSNGELGTPNNVHDTAWYTGSAKPGQPGATLIDGHVSSWTTRGAFYGIKTLAAGDMIQIVRGDNSVLTYKVVKTHIYDADAVDMQAAVTPVTPGKSGLNLISCTGRVKPGTNHFTQRVVVFAEQV